MRVAIFTDNDFEKVNGVTTTLPRCCARAARFAASASTRRRGWAVDGRDYLALPVAGRRHPVLPRHADVLAALPQIVGWMKRDRIDVVHLTTPGPMGWRPFSARRLRLPLIGSFHTDLALYTAGAQRLAAARG